MIHGTRLLKSGMDANHAVVLDLIWNSTDDSKSSPNIHASIISISEFAPDEDPPLDESKSYAILDTLVNTHLCVIPQKYRRQRQEYWKGG